MKSCAGIEKKRSVLTESKERSGSSYESSSGAAAAASSSPPPPSSILGWPIRKASFRKHSKENIKFDHNKPPAIVTDSSFKGKEVNIAGLVVLCFRLQCSVFVTEKKIKIDFFSRPFLL